MAADNLQVLNPAVAGALEHLDPYPLKELARRCEEAGAGLTYALADVLQPGFRAAVRLLHQMS